VDGICPFATDYVDYTKMVGWQQGCSLRVGFCDHTAGGWYETMLRPGFWNDPNGDGTPSDAVSIHFAIARDGRIAQVLNIFDTAFAQGRTNNPITWPYYTTYNTNPNNLFISTEHEDYERVNGVSRYVTGWTEAQYNSDLRVKKWCIEECLRVKNWEIMRHDIDSLTGHFMFDPVNRPNCPGSWWPRQRLYNDLVGGADLFVPYNAWPAYIQGLKIPAGQEAWINIFADFKFPQAKSYQIEFLVRKGFVEVYHGSGLIAKRMGWTEKSKPYSDEAHVIPTDTNFVGSGINGAGWIKFKAGPAEDVEFEGASALGYWT